MSNNKKVKGQKLDLASFVGPSNPTSSLPTAPDPSRVRAAGGRGGGFDGAKDRFQDKDRFDSERGDRHGGRGGRGGGGFDRERGERPERNYPESRADNASSWSRGDRSQDSRESSSFGGPRRGPPNRFNSKEEEIDDPRFAGKFGSSSGYKPVFGAKQQTREEVQSFALPTAPRAVAVAASVVPMPIAPPVAAVEPVVNAMEELKLQKIAEKKEIQKKAQSAKEKAIQDAADKLNKLKADNLIAASAAKDLLAGNLKGTELLTAAKSATVKTNGSMLLQEIFNKHEDIVTYQWYAKTEYGTLLHALLSTSAREQTNALYVVQEYCANLKYPKVEVKGVARKLIEVLFGNLLQNDLVDLEGFLGWADDEGPRPDESTGRTDAIIQTTNFIQQVRQAMLNGGDGEEDEDEDEIDEPRQTV